MKILIINCSYGLKLDMLLGALVQISQNQEYINKQLKKFNLVEYQLELINITKHNYNATQALVYTQPSDNSYSLQTIISLLEESNLTPYIKNITVNTFLTLAQSNKEVSGLTPEQIIIDNPVESIYYLIGVAACLETLAPKKIFLSSLGLGNGLVRCQDRWIPVPNPVTANLLKGYPVKFGPVEGELIGQLEAALLNVMIEDFTTPPVFIPLAYGYGIHHSEQLELHLISAITADTRGDSPLVDEVATLETNIDDMNPEFYPYLVEKFLAQGALDVYLTPIIMKKGRPAVKLSILCRPSTVQLFAELLLKESSSLGIRISYQDRRIASREIIRIETAYGPIKVKIARLDPNSPILRVTPEYEDCKKAALMYNVPINQVYQESIKNSQTLK